MMYMQYQIPDHVVNNTNYLLTHTEVLLFLSKAIQRLSERFSQALWHSLLHMGSECWRPSCMALTCESGSAGLGRQPHQWKRSDSSEKKEKEFKSPIWSSPQHPLPALQQTLLRKDWALQPSPHPLHPQWFEVMVFFATKDEHYLLTQSERSQTETLSYWPSNSEVNTARGQGGLRFSHKDWTFEVNKLFIIWLFASVLKANRLVSITGECPTIAQSDCMVPENICTPPTEGIGISWGWGVLWDENI